MIVKTTVLGRRHVTGHFEPGSHALSAALQLQTGVSGRPVIDGSLGHELPVEQLKSTTSPSFKTPCLVSNWTLHRFSAGKRIRLCRANIMQTIDNTIDHQL